MDEFSLPMKTQEIYDEVEATVNKGKMCTSQKEAEEYVQILQSISRGLPNRAVIKIGEICGCLLEYCKPGADKVRLGEDLNNLLGGLSMMVKYDD